MTNDEACKILMEPIKVLDFGYVRLVDKMGQDEDIISAARMSTSKGFNGWGTPEEPGDEKLLEFLYKNQHSTPFEFCELAVEINAPIMCWREIQRHRVFSFNEASARYAQMPDLHYVPEQSRFAPKLTGNKQESSKEYVDFSGDAEFRTDVQAEQRAVYDFYEEMIEGGVPREVARINTPVSRYSKARMKGDLRGWLGFLNLRLRPNAQYETRMYAEAVASIVKVLWPRTYALFHEYDLCSVRLSANEVAELLICLPKGFNPSIIKKLEGQ